MEATFTTFNHDDPKYRCCCGHVKTGFTVFMILAIIGAVGSMFNVMKGDSTSVLSFIINVTVATTLCIAYTTDNEKFLYPYMVLTAFGIPITLGVIFYLMVNMKSLGSHEQSVVGTLIFVLIIVNLINLYLLSVVYQFYKYLVDLNKYRKMLRSSKPAECIVIDIHN